MNGLCGIDEAGRGCLAGSLFVAGVVLPTHLLDSGFFEGLRDSKQLTPNSREIWFEKILQNAHFCIIEKSSHLIDTVGLSQCFRDALSSIRQNLPASQYLFDGNTNFGLSRINTLIKGDRKVKSISAASVLAKVCKDTQMRILAKEFPHFSFEKHKGYGTKQHLQAITKMGISPKHRKTFCKSMLEQTLF